MDYYAIKFRSLSRLLFAHQYQTTKHSWGYPIEPRLVEITYLEQGDLRFYSDEEPGSFVKAPCILITPHCHYTHAETTSELHRHYTFSFFVDFPAEILTEQNFKNQDFLSDMSETEDTVCVLPGHIPDGAVCEKIAQNIQRIISCSQSMLPVDRLKVHKYIFDILAEASQYASEQKENTFSKSYTNIHIVRALQYINANIEKQFRVQEIADMLQISYVYLSRTFHQEMGMTLVQYINKLKLKRVKELMLAKDITLEEAGAAVGIENVKYLSRIFKTYNGMTATEYKKMCRNKIE